MGRRGRGAPLLPEGPRPADARRVRADRRPREGADGVLAGALARSSRPSAATSCSTRWRSTASRRRPTSTRRRHEPIKLDLYKDVFPDRMPYYAEHVRRYITSDTATTRCSSDGLRVETAAEPTWEAAAYENADYGARHQDKRQGWRGPEWRVDGAARETFIARQKQLYGTGAARRRASATSRVVDKVDGEKADVHHRRPQAHAAAAQHELGREVGGRQRRERQDDRQRDRRRSSPATSCGSSREIAHRRQVPRLQPARQARTRRGSSTTTSTSGTTTHTDIVKLEQVPHPQTTIFTADHHNGYVVAMVGGYDYDRSVFNRAVQACRQPGSTYKPIYYSLGLDQGYGFDTILNDVPVKIIDPDTGEEWTPTNLERHAWTATSRSSTRSCSRRTSRRSICSSGSARRTSRTWARRLGFTTKIFADDALALGASCSKLDEMARAFTRVRAQRHVVAAARRATRRTGSTSAGSSTATATRSRTTRSPRIRSSPPPTASIASRALAGIEAPQAIPARTAFLMTQAARARGRVRLRERAARDRHQRRRQDRHVERDARHDCSSRSRRSSRRSCGWATTRRSARSARPTPRT